MTDDEILQAVLEKLNDIDMGYRGQGLLIRVYMTEDLKIDSMRELYKHVTFLIGEQLIENIDHPTLELVGMTDKGRHFMENGGWPAYKLQMDAQSRKVARAEKLAEMKTFGEAMQFKFWWLTLALGLIGTIGALYQLFHTASPVDSKNEELFRNIDSLRREVEIVRKNQTITTLQPAQPTKPTSSSTK